jgi:putative lipoic acid-binding regulatory protein
MDKDIKAFRDKLEAVYEWPSLYMFKFIVPAEKQQEVEDIFPKHDVQRRPSKNGKYVSVTIKLMASSADVIIEKYIEANKIEGILAL